MNTKNARIHPAALATDKAWIDFIRRRDQLLKASEAGALAFYRAQHPLWTPEMAAVLPTEDEAGSAGDPTCFYCLKGPPGLRYSEWYVLSATPKPDGDVTFMVYSFVGYRQNAEVGYASLNEMRSIRGRFFLNIETIRYYSPEKLSAVRARIEGVAAQEA